MNDGAHEEEDEQIDDRHAVPPVELVKSYLKFAARAIRPRWKLVAGLLATGVLLTLAVFVYFPRTYNCRAVMMAVGNPVLEGNAGGNPLAGAPSLVMRRESLEGIVRDADLVRKFEERRPPLLRVKDRLITLLFGEFDEATKIAIMVGTLETRLSINTEDDGNLSISADWTDGKTAAEIVETARQAYLGARHTAEVSAFQAKMSILDEHASKLRAEIEGLAQQINAAHEERAAQVTKAAGVTPAPAAPAPAAAGLTARPRATGGVRTGTASVLSGAEAAVTLAEQKAQLAEKKEQLAQMEADRQKGLQEQQAKLAEMRLHLTASHPAVVTQEERITLLQQVPTALVMLRGEVAELESTIKQRELLARSAGGRGAGAAGAAAATNGSATGSAPPLPMDIILALENDAADPALAAQLGGAVAKYGALRDDIRSGRIALDTAQAAFNQRYKIVVPAEEPQKPYKPKPAVLLGGGLAISLLLALLVPILVELRRGIIIEKWQVHQIQLPVLAELHLPPRSLE